MDYEMLKKYEDNEYKIKTELNKDQIEEKILGHFYFLKEKDNLKKFYDEYNAGKSKISKSKEKDEDRDIILGIWGKIIKFLLEDILHCFYIKISDIIKYTTIQNEKPKAIEKIMQELRFHFGYITKSDLLSLNFYKDNFPDLYPQNNFIKNIINCDPYSETDDVVREEKNEENESVKKSIRKDLSEDETIPEDSILFNYEIFKTHCDFFLMVITDILENNDKKVFILDDLINDIKQNYVENERGKNEELFKLRYGTQYLYETLIYLQNIKKIKIFTINLFKKDYQFVKVLKDKDDIVDDADIKEARIIVINQKKAQK